MKKACCALFCVASLAVASTGVMAADEVSLDSGTLLGLSRRDVAGMPKESLLPVTQFVGLNAERLGRSKLSFHLYGWGRLDLADNSYNGKSGDGSLTYGYFQYTPGTANAYFRAGRQFIRDGIVNEQVDGISFRTDLPRGFTLSAFGGAPVHMNNLPGENSDGKGTSLYGGRLSYRHKGALEVGLSGVYEGDGPEMKNPVHAVGSYRRVGGDLWYTPVYGIDVMGHSSYNPETKEFAEHSYLVTVKKFPKLVVSTEFNLHKEQSYLGSWAMFSKTLIPNEQSSSVGVSASYEVSKTLELSADYKHYSRDFGSADRLGGDARVHYKDNSIRGGFGYHYLNAGEGFAIGSNPSGSYHELRCYLMRDTKGYFGAVDLLGDFFKDAIYGVNSAWETTASIGYHVTPLLSVSGDVSYGHNPQFTEEARALLRMTYNTTFSGNGGKK